MDLGQIDNQKGKKISEPCYREIIKRLIVEVAVVMGLENVHYSSQGGEGRSIATLPPFALLQSVISIIFQ